MHTNTSKFPEIKVCYPKNIFQKTFFEKNIFYLFFRFPSPPEFTGVLKPNTDLQKATLLLKGKILGPESILVEGNTLYTGTWDAKILQIVDGQIKKTIYLNNPLSECATFDSEPICGRPLGIRRLNKDLLVVADTYYGVYTVNVATGKI